MALPWEKQNPKDVNTMRLQKEFHTGGPFHTFCQSAFSRDCFQLSKYFLSPKQWMLGPQVRVTTWQTQCSVDVRIKRLSNSPSTTQITIHWNSLWQVPTEETIMHIKFYICTILNVFSTDIIRHYVTCSRVDGGGAKRLILPKAGRKPSLPSSPNWSRPNDRPTIRGLDTIRGRRKKRYVEEEKKRYVEPKYFESLPLA